MNGLIPEEVYTKQSMTLKYAKNFDTPFGRFEYTHISKSAFSVGLTSIKKDGYAFVMAILPFVRNPKELDIWSNDYFVQLADMMKFE